MRVLLAIVLCGMMAAQPLPIVPGIGLLGQVYNILTLSVSASMFNFSYHQNNTSPDHKYSLPDGVMFAQDNECVFVARTFTTSFYSEYKDELSYNLNVEGKYKNLTASYSRESQNVHETLAKEDVYVSVSSAECKTYDLDVESIAYPSVVISDAYRRSILALPPALTEATYPAFAHFFDTFGTHVRIGCDVGGTLQQYTFTQTVYVKDHGVDKTKSQAGAAFYVKVDASRSRDNEVTREFNSSSTFGSIIVQGGLYPSAPDNWASWAQSVQNLPPGNDLLRCTAYSAVELSQFLPLNISNDSELDRMYEPLNDALALYLTRPGCTDPTALNFNASALSDNGSCKYPCSHWELLNNPPGQYLAFLGTFPGIIGDGACHAQTGLYVLNGPANGRCLVAIAVAPVSRDKTASAGATGWARTGQQYLTAMRSDDSACKYGGEHSVTGTVSSPKMGVVGQCSGPWACSTGVNAPVGPKGDSMLVQVSQADWGRGTAFGAFAALDEFADPNIYDLE